MEHPMDCLMAVDLGILKELQWDFLMELLMDCSMAVDLGMETEETMVFQMVF